MGRASQHVWLPLATLIVAMAGVFALRIATPLGVPVHVLYFPVLMAAALSLGPLLAWILFSACAVLISVGALVAPRHAMVDQITLVVASQFAAIPVAAIILLLTLKLNRSRAAQRDSWGMLQHSTEQLRQFVEQVPAAVAMFDRDMRYLAHSRRWLQLDPERYKGATTLVGTLHYSEFANFPTHWKEAHRRAMAGETVRCEHEVLMTPAGQEEVGRWEVIPWYDHKGQVGGVLLLVEMITERVEIERRWRDTAMEFRTLAENLPDLVARFDRQLRFVYVNRAVQVMLGTPAEEIIGKTDVEIGLPEEMARVRERKMREVLATGCERTNEFVFQGSSGPRHFESRIVPERTSEGTIQTILCICRDVTERVRAREQAELHLAELAHATRLSTIGGLVSEIAHEINQPLHAIVNFAQASINVLEKTPADSRPNLFGWLRQISEQANRAAEIIRRAGRFARKTPVRRSTVDLNALVRDCLNLVNFDLRLHHVKLQCDLAAHVPLLLVDTVQIQQLLVNLVRNAVEAMSDHEENDRRLTVRTNVIDNALQVSVSDNGTGMNAEATEKLFEPFFTTKPEGLGLGLAVCQSIVQAHEGSLWAEPNPDRGTTFHFTLPIYKEELHDVHCHV